MYILANASHVYIKSVPARQDAAAMNSSSETFFPYLAVQPVMGSMAWARGKARGHDEPTADDPAFLTPPHIHRKFYNAHAHQV